MEVAALEHLKVPIDLKWLSGERSLPFGQLVFTCYDALLIARDGVMVMFNGNALQCITNFKVMESNV